MLYHASGRNRDKRRQSFIANLTTVQNYKALSCTTSVHSRSHDSTQLINIRNEDYKTVQVLECSKLATNISKQVSIFFNVKHKQTHCAVHGKLKLNKQTNNENNAIHH